jgi:DNA-directed RNA polymerase II subunit RPB1
MKTGLRKQAQGIVYSLCVSIEYQVHLSGVSSASKAVRGVPRIKELLSITVNIKSPSMTIYIDNKDDLSKDKNKCKQIMYTIKTTYFKDIVTNTKIYYEPDDFRSKIDNDILFLESYKEFVQQKLLKTPDLTPWLLRMEFDKEKMLEYEITMIDIFYSLQDFYDDNIHLMFSDDNADKLIIRIKLYQNDDYNDTEKDIITDLKALEKNIIDNIIIKGIRKISKMVMIKKESNKYNKETMLFDKYYEWALETSGSNLIDILAHKNIDKTRTICNDVNEIYSIFGIEAARQALYNEIWDVIKDADLYVNYRHLSLLVDTMTNKGYLLSIDRHGINRVDIGPLAKSSFEETNDMIIQAGIFSEIDKINGVSANIMLGQVAACGCGDGDLIIDEQKLQDIENERAEQESTDNLDIDEICTLENLSMDFTPPVKNSNIIKKSTIKLNIS